jgi:putative sterol carrier protein
MDAIKEGYELGMAIGEKIPGAEFVHAVLGTDDRQRRIANRIKSGSLSEDDIHDYMAVLVQACNGNQKVRKKARKSVLAFQFELVGGTDYWIRIDHGLFSTGEGNIEKPDVIIRMNATIAPGIFSGEINAASAYMSKQLAFIGPMKHGIAFRNWVNLVRQELGL